MERQHPSVAAAHSTFGDLLRHLRRQAYMTQRDLALATGYSIGQICRFEQNQCVPDLPTLTARFIPALIQASDTATTERLLAFAHTARTAHQEGQRRSPPLLLVSEEPGGEHDSALAVPPLPIPATVLLGREREVAQVCALLRQATVRLLTLTGAPGIGKTRLGLQVAADLHATFADGVIFVPLAPIREPHLVISAIAQTLGIKETSGQPLVYQLKQFLRDKHLLLLLDNFEHVLDAAPLIAELMASAGELRLLVTSRERLHLRGEKEVAVPPLALPDRADLPPLDQLPHYAAVALFIQRAVDARPDFQLTNANAAAVAEICARLDGLPLAIELAAARSKLFAPAALVARLSSRLALLTGGMCDLPLRQQTMRATIAWSYDLLTDAEQTLLRRLGAFVGGCTLEAAEAVCTAAGDLGSDVLDGLAALVDQSLVRQEEGLGGEPRFTMLETISEYALERLEASGEAEALQRQHAAYYLALVEAVAPALIGAQQGAWLDRLEVEYDNLRMTLQWAIDRKEGAIAGQMCAALAIFWYARSYLSEGRKWLEQALAQLDTGLPLVEVRAKVLYGAGMLAYTQGDYGPAFAWLEESVALAREIRDQPGTALALDAMGWTALVQGEHARAQPFFEEGLALFQELGQTYNIAVCLTSLGAMALVQGDYMRATALCEESLALGRAVGAKEVISLCLSTLGATAILQGDIAQAQSCFEECLALCQELGNKLLTAVCLIGLAGVAAAQGQATRAARLAGGSESLLHAIGSSVPPVARSHYELIVAATRSQLGEAAFAAAWREGQTMPLEQVIADGLSHND